MKRLWIFFVLLLAGCSAGPKMTSFFMEQETDSWLGEEQKKNQQTVVSMMLPLSGTWETTGQTFQKAALLALDENPNAKVKILFFDTQSTAEGTQKAYKWAMAQNPSIILGPVFADEFKALPNSMLNQPVLGYTSDSTLLSPNRASFAVLIPEQIREIIHQNCVNGKQRLAVIGPDGKTGEIVMNALDDFLPQCPGMELKKYAIYSSQKADMSEEIRQILPKIIDPKKKNLTEQEKEILDIPMSERLDFDSLLVFEDGTKLAQVMSILAFYDVTPSVIPIYTLTSAKGLKDHSLNGVLMTDLPTDNHFSKKYQQAFGEKPMRLASLAYDSVNWIAKESEAGSVSLESLRSSEDYRGVDGLIRLLPDGTNRRALRLIQKKGKGIVEMSPAINVFKDESVLPDIPEQQFMQVEESIDSTSTFPEVSDESLGDFE